MGKKLQIFGCVAGVVSLGVYGLSYYMGISASALLF
jgi:hypothetical protein